MLSKKEILAAFDTRENIHRNIYFFGLSLIALGLPLSKFLMSLGQIILIVNWIFEGEIIRKLYSFRKNKIAILVCSVFGLHIAGLLYTSNFDYAFNDLRIKLPLLLFPLILSTSNPLSSVQIRRILYLFIFSVFAGSMVSMYFYSGLAGEVILDIRDISRFISHIRFSLLLCLAVFILLVWVINKDESSGKKKFIHALLCMWFVVFLFILQSFTGIFILCLILLLSGIWKIWNVGKYVGKITVLLLLAAFIPALYLGIQKTETHFFTPKEISFTSLEEYSQGGEKYTHDTLNPFTENGYPLWIYIAQDEFIKTWNNRSKIDINGRGQTGQDIYYTALRFLTSKGLRKDEQGVNSLSEVEITAIENGIPNVRYMNSNGIKSRLLQIMWELDVYRKGGNPSGHSLTQRLEFWKAAVYIIGQNPVFGVGTGDLPEAYSDAYQKIHSKLHPSMQLRAHNQLLTFGVAFGIAGLFIFLLSFILPLFQKNRSPYFPVFLLIAFLSFLNEDTLETQAGVTFFAFFNAFFLFTHKDEEE